MAGMNPKTKNPPPHYFPKMKNTRILTVLKGERADKIPIWLLRQAGRYLPEFRELRQKHSFQEICTSPELASEVTMFPIRRFHFDAAIIFSDITVVPEALGMKLLFNPGPIFPEPITVDNIDRILKPENAMANLQCVGDAITMTRHKLDGEAVLYGFTGAPWTLMSYMIEGSGSLKFNKARRWLYTQKEAVRKVINILTHTIADFCILQAKAGAQVLQLFDSNADFLTKELYEEYFIHPLKIIRQRVKETLRQDGYEEVPMVIYAKGAFFALEDFGKIGYDCINLDCQTEPSFVRACNLPKNICLQGNLDPCALYAPEDELREIIHRMLRKFKDSNLIVNFGTGILMDTPLEGVATLIETVRGFEQPEK